MSAKSPIDDSPGDSTRRDRAAIAAQACQTCRSRKSKCDEQRPRCGLCTRLGVECVYREPQPTKKDKTLVHILSVLERVESKVDRLGLPTTNLRNDDRVRKKEEPSLGGPLASWEQVESDTRQRDRRETYLPSDLISANTHLTAAHKILVWPSVFLLLTNARVPVMNDIHHIMQTGTPWFTHLELKKHTHPLATNGSPIPSKSPSIPNHSFAPGIAGLDADTMRSLADAYFDTFNVVHPILDRNSFYSDILLPVIRGGYEDRDTQACLAMLIMALGSIALEGVSGAPFLSHSKTPSGLRGGSIEAPPGLDIFNEARRRLGFVMHTCTLENVQIYLLQAAYYESCARHMDFWRSCAAASMSFQIFVRCERINWSSPKADLIKRVYWTCILNEDLYHLELDLPKTGIYTLEDQIPLPSFQQSRNMTNAESEDASHYHYHFLAMIALRRLIARIHASLHSDNDTRAESSEGYDGPPIHLINELARQLESWRTYLPQALQWSDADTHSFPNVNPLARRQPSPLFTVQDNGEPVTHRYNLDIVTGHLRTRFYYARYMIYRPFIFKALHFPEAMTPDDASYCALAIQSACMWPLAMSPCKNKKRLVPHLFTWTQNFVGILLIMRMTSESECLRRICEERVNMRDMQLTVGLMLEWIADMKEVDGIAEWSWGLLEPLFRGWT
ncbi:hypothetical protein KVT40_002042 [Elsinoe batatas]|uniref:Zn(2)-C6 fungal-type domain-containing protein n=1 Tax=Elsinoe batatas TaxID=2601811 RepID=A0A8K0L970_9PEZI|nr:hypothetical protein KVT40_002042 [Elsinoe batatas]